MRCAAALALLLCAGQVTALPVNSPMDKGDTEVMKCIVEVISDTLSKPSPTPVSPECLETLRGDERILSILRHQNLLKELQDLALQGAQERTQQHKKHRSFEEELSEVLEDQSSEAASPEVTGEPSSKDAAERRDATEGTRPQGLAEPGQGHSQAPGEEAPSTQPPASPAGHGHPGPEAEGDSEGPAQGLVDTETDPRAEQAQQTRRQQEEEEAGAAEKAAPQEEGPTAASDPPLSLGYKDPQNDERPSEALGVDGAPKPEAEETRRPEGRGTRAQPRRQQEEEDLAGAPQGPTRGGKGGEQEPERRPSREWEEATRWSKMDQLARELTAGRRLEGEDEEAEPDPDRSMRLSFRARAFGPRGPGLQLRRGWRPSSREDSVEAGLPLQARGYPEEKKEEEGSANRRAEDQELESLSAIEAELEKVAHQLQALRQG